MPTLTCEIEGVAVVLLGSFNPAIFHPAWLAQHALIREAEASAAEIQIIRPEIAVFSVGSFSVQVQLDRFIVEVLDAGQSKPLLQLVTSIFEILSETPIRQLGINRQMHFRVGSDAELHAIGHRLVPKQIYAGILDEPGMRSVTVWGKRPQSSAARVELSIAPSLTVQPGVVVATNEHFELASESSGAARAMSALRDNWEPAQAYAQRLANDLLQRALVGGSQ